MNGGPIHQNRAQTGFLSILHPFQFRFVRHFRVSPHLNVDAIEEINPQLFQTDRIKKFIKYFTHFQFNQINRSQRTTTPSLYLNRRHD